MIMNLVLSLHFLSLGTMLGVIWMVQFFLYPALRLVPEAHFVSHHQRHASLISRVVGPAMLAELFSGIGLWNQHRDFFWTAQLVLIGFNFLLTFVFAVSWHEKLSRGKDLPLIEKIIQINTARTLCWSLRAACMLGWVLYFGG